MKYVFVLSKEIPNIAKEEVLSLINIKNYQIINNILIIEIKNQDEATLKNLYKRLAYTNSIYSLLFQSNYEDFLIKMENFDWNSIYQDNFCIRINKINLNNEKTLINKIIDQNTIKNDTIKKISINKKSFKNYKTLFNDNISLKNLNNNPKNNNKLLNKKKVILSEKKLASYIWKNVENPKVNLKNPKTQIEIFIFKDRILCCLLLKKLNQKFDKRKSHLRPRPSPISLHPKLARAMINLTGAKEGETIIDPFCGSGGILIESGLMGFRTIGYDINKKMIWKSMVNLKHYSIKNYKLKVKDFFDINKKFKYIVSDLPYGLNTNIMENIRVTKNNKHQIKQYLNDFYTKVIKKLEKILVKKAVIIFPSYINYKKIIKNSRLILIDEFESYVHGNLTRKIVVLSK